MLEIMGWKEKQKKWERRKLHINYVYVHMCNKK